LLEEEEAISYLASHPAVLRLDLHGVLDCLLPTIPIANIPIVCISFVGPNTHIVAKEDIQRRIQTGQITYGVLVFKRGRGKDAKQFVEAGGKAWVNRHIPPMEPTLFVDDSKDHIRSTQFVVPSVMCMLFTSKDPTSLMKFLQNWVHTNIPFPPLVP
jgi:hypothetical protein